MSLSHDIISEFVKVTNNNKEKPKEGIVYATIVQGSDGKYVKIDGSDLLTPADTTTDIEDGERVTVMIKDHKATVTGNVTSPSASGNRVDKVVDTVTEQIGVFETVVADKISVNELEAYKIIVEELIAGKATIEDLEATNAVIENLKVKDAEIENAVIDKATIEDLEAVNAKIENLEVKDAEIENAVIDNLEATKAEIKILNADFAQIKTLVSGNLTSDNILSFNITADKVTMEDAFIKDAMIANVNAAKINAGRINTNSVVIGSEDGGMSISGATQQFTDKNGNVRIQIGRDASDDFTFVLYGEDGRGQIINQNGITASAIGDGLIVNDMVSNDAAISGGKLDISSVIMKINDDDSTTIRSNKIYLDEQNQSLEVAFKSLKTQVDTIKDIDSDLTTITDKIQSNTSKIEANKSSISTLLAEDAVIKRQVTDLEGNVVETTNTLTSRYTSLQQDLSGFKTSVGKTYATQSSVNDLNNNLTSNYSTTSAMNSAISQGIGSITSSISETYATKKQVQSIDDDIKANYSTTKQMETAITQAKSDIELSVSETYETKTEVSNKVSDAIKDMQIGGRNLMRYSDPSMLRNLDVTDKWRTGRGVIKSSIFDVTGEKYYWLVLNDNQTDAWACLKDASDRLINFEADTEYTLSFKSYIGQSCKGIRMMLFSSDDKKNKIVLDYTKKSMKVGEHYAPKVTFKSSYPAYLCIYNKGLETGTTGQVSLLFREIKIEKGNKGTDWTPAQEDISENITNAESNAIVESKKYADSQITIAQGAIELNVSETYETKTEVTNKVSNAVNGLQIGGRNLIIRSTETKDRYVDPSGNIATVKGYAISDYIEVKSGESIAFSKQHSATTDNYYRWAWYKNNKTYMSRSADSTNKFVWTVPNGATYIRVSYPTDCLPKIERGTKHTDWSPAPEDITADISQAKSDAINSANGTLTTTLESYYTKSETESEIKAAKGSIELSVSETYETKTEVSNKVTNAINALQIGGRNLMRYSDPTTLQGVTVGDKWQTGRGTIKVEVYDNEKYYWLVLNDNQTDAWACLKDTSDRLINFEADTEYTLSFKSYIGQSCKGIRMMLFSSDDKKNKIVLDYTKKSMKVGEHYAPKVTFKSSYPAYLCIYNKGLETGTTGQVSLLFREIKIEKGNKMTDWSPAPGDIDSSIATAKSSVITECNRYADSQISVAKGNIELNVSKIYETKTTVTGLKNQLTQTKQNIRCNNLGAKINYSSFSTTNTGEIYLHGYDSDNNPTDTNGKIYWNGAELSVPKGMINPDSAFPFNTDVYIFMSKSYVDYIYGLYYNTTTKAWAYKPLIGASDSSTNWTPDSRHIALGVFNMASAEQFNHAYLFETPQSLVQLTIGSANLTSRMNTAESKITDTAITNVVKQNFYTKTETNNQITSKGYQTSSQVKQTVDALELKFTQSGGYNLIRNGKAAVDLKCWTSNGGGIQRTTDSVYKTCIKTSLPSGIKYNGGDSGSAIRLKNSTHYVYEAVVYSRTALPGTNVSPLHFWCSTSPSTSGTGQCSIVNYRQAVPTVNKWTKCYVHILTAASGEVWFTPFIYTGGSYTGDIWVTEISLSESSVETPYSPHASEIYDGVTTIDKDGVTVKSSSGAYTNFNNLGMNSFNNSGQQTLGIKNGGITFHPYNTNQLGAYITQSALWSGSVASNGLAISTANNGTYISLGTSSLSDANTSLNMDQALTISASDGFQPRGINFWKNVHAHGYGIRQLAHLQLAGSSPIQFDYLNTSPSTIYEATSSGHSLYVMGGYQMHLGCMDGTGTPKGVIWMQNSTNTHSYTHWNFHNYTMYNMKTATSYANTLTNRCVETYGINSNVDGIRYLYRNIELVDGVGIRNLPNGYKGCPYDIVSIVCKGRGHAWVECEDEYRFIINGDCKSVNVEIIIYPTDGVMTMSSLAPDESPTLEAIPERNIGEQPVIITNEGSISVESEQE